MENVKKSCASQTPTSIGERPTVMVEAGHVAPRAEKRKVALEAYKKRVAREGIKKLARMVRDYCGS